MLMVRSFTLSSAAAPQLYAFFAYIFTAIHKVCPRMLMLAVFDEPLAPQAESCLQKCGRTLPGVPAANTCEEGKHSSSALSLH